MRPKLLPWIETFTGKQFWFLDPKPEMIDIIDIAHALAHTCRYGGHASRFYSVAEHCVIMSRFMEGANFANDACFAALMHDAAEAYLGDIPAPIKDQLPQFKELEEVVETAIARKFKLRQPLHPIIKEYDMRILKDEKRQVMGNVPWGEQMENVWPLGVELYCWAPEMAKKRFLQQFEHIAAKMSGEKNAEKVS